MHAVTTAATAPPAVLTAGDAEILAFEHGWYARPGDKLSAITAVLGLRPTAYYQALHRIVDLPAALAADPVTVNRLRRLREARLRVRRRWAP